jgi:xylulose-5-phosphate/fructose-6-phosphate phosphoketolase
VNVTDLFALVPSDKHPHGMSNSAFKEVFTEDRPVLFNFHGYPSAVHQLIHRRPHQDRFHVRGYSEEGTTTTPFDLLAMNGVDRYQLAIEALSRADLLASDLVYGMSGRFAVRAIPDAERAIVAFREKLTATRQYIREMGDDPAEVTDWTWSKNGLVS